VANHAPKKKKEPSWLSRKFASGALAFGIAAGKPFTFILCCLLIVVWALTGPLFHYSDTWQLVINTGTTIITFLMVFLIQNMQNRDAAAIQAKLDELIYAVKAARNELIGIETLSDEEVDELRIKLEKRVQRLEARKP
jgi:low affinity Fe/Cu permease